MEEAKLILKCILLAPVLLAAVLTLSWPFILLVEAIDDRDWGKVMFVLWLICGLALCVLNLSSCTHIEFKSEPQCTKREMYIYCDVGRW